MRSRRRTRIGAALLTAALVVAACGDDDDKGGSGGTVGGGAALTTLAPVTTAPNEFCTKEREGGSIKVAALANVPSMDPFNGAGGSIQNGYEHLPFYSQLFVFNLDSGKFDPQVAESATANADASEWTIKLRNNVKFGNGDTLDADAFVAHLDRHLTEGSRSVLAAGARVFIKSYAKVDPLTVKFTLQAPWGNFPALLTSGIGMVQNTKLITQMGQEAFAKLPKGGGVGPYEIESWSPPESIVFKAKENWWGGPVCIKQITVSVIPGTVAAYQAFSRNEVNVIGLNRDPDTQDKAVKENPGRVKGQLNNSAFMILPNISSGGYNGPLKDKRVRQAVAYSIDANVINQRALGGKGLPGKGIVNEKTRLLKPTQGLPYDPAKAKQLLDAYKAETGWDGTLQGICGATPATNKEACITVAALMNNVGFKVNMNAELAVGALITQVAAEKKFELVGSWGIINDEANLFRGLNGWDSRNVRNQNGYANPRLDAVIDAMRAATTPAAYQKTLDDYQAIVNEDVPFIVYGATEDVTVFKENIKGITWSQFHPMFDKAYLTTR